MSKETEHLSDQSEDGNSEHPRELAPGSRGRRRFLIASTAVVGAAGMTVASWPFIASWLPSAKAKVGGAPVQINISKIKPGTVVKSAWRGQPVWVVRRTPDMLKRLASQQLQSLLSDPDSEVATQQPVYARNEFRAIKDEYFVVIAVCTHLGCIPLWRPDFPADQIDSHWMGGFFCPCHKSKFDLAGRVFKGVPAPTNLVVPPYQYLNSSLLEIGTEKGGNPS